MHDNLIAMDTGVVQEAGEGCTKRPHGGLKQNVEILVKMVRASIVTLLSKALSEPHSLCITRVDNLE
jgi:hypothetical protein